jgi:hypothetical protein
VPAVIQTLPIRRRSAQGRRTQTNNITGKRYIDHWIEAGFECSIPIKNTAAGAAMMRIEAAGRAFPRCRFNETTTQAGLEALGFYHEKKDEVRNIGMGARTRLVASIVAGRVLKQLGVIGRHETNSGSARDIKSARSCSPFGLTIVGEIAGPSCSHPGPPLDFQRKPCESRDPGKGETP